MFVRHLDLTLAWIVALLSLSSASISMQSIEREQQRLVETRTTPLVHISYGERFLHILQRSPSGSSHCVGQFKISTREDSVTAVLIHGQIGTHQSPISIEGTLGFNPLQQLYQGTLRSKTSTQDLFSIEITGTKTLKAKITSPRSLSEPITMDIQGPVMKRNSTKGGFDVIMPTLDNTKGAQVLATGLSEHIRQQLGLSIEERESMLEGCEQIAPINVSQLNSLLPQWLPRN